MSTESGPAGSNSLGSIFAAARRYWWVPLGTVTLAVIGALLVTAFTPTTYVGRTSLIVSSNDRAPEQDAVLVQGYVAYFDNEAYQQQLLAQAGVDPEATVTAQAAAASPILVVTATAADAGSAQAAAIALAKAFKDDINAVHARTTAADLATVQGQLDTALARNGKDDQAVIVSLQDRIRQLQADQDNVLQELQLQGGVSVQPPSLLNNLVLAIAGGLFVGAFVAFALARWSRRLRTQEDVMDKVGLNTLIELPATRAKGAPRQRVQLMRQLASILRGKIGDSGVVVVTQAGDGAATWVVAHALALEWATQGYTTVVIRFGDEGESARSRRDSMKQDVGKPLEPSATLSRMRPGSVPGMSIIDMRLRLVGGAANLPAAKVTNLLELDPFVGAFVIIETSRIASTAAAQAASQSADATLLVIDTQVAKVAETREAVEVLRQSGVVPLGAILAPVSVEESHPDEGDFDEQGGEGQPGSAQLSQESRDGAGWSW